MEGSSDEGEGLDDDGDGDGFGILASEFEREMFSLRRAIEHGGGAGEGAGFEFRMRHDDGDDGDDVDDVEAKQVAELERVMARVSLLRGELTPPSVMFVASGITANEISEGLVRDGEWE